PFAAVDPIVRARLQEQFLGIQERLRKTIVFVTHDIDEAIKMADRIAILNKGGVIEQYAPPKELLRTPANPFVENFVGPERGLKRLALITVSEIDVEEGPVASRALEHVELTVLAVVFGLLISFPLAIIAYRHQRLQAPIASIASLLYTIPSLALISLLVTVTGFSYTTVVIPLTMYTLLILIRNILAGLEGVPEDARDAARGMGFTQRQMLWRVEIPLAMPVIIAGIRIATVSTIGLITIAALIGRGGFGEFILDGL